MYVANTGTDFFTTGYANLTSTVSVINGATCNGHITTGCYPRLLPVRTGGWPAYTGLDPGSRHHICARQRRRRLPNPPPLVTAPHMGNPPHTRPRARWSFGEVVGRADTTAGSSDSALWNGKTITGLAPLGVVGANGINDSGQIAGMCNTGTYAFACVVSNGKIAALPAPATFPDCTDAIAINNNGQIVAEGNDGNGVTVFLLTPS